MMPASSPCVFARRGGLLQAGSYGRGRAVI